METNQTLNVQKQIFDLENKLLSAMRISDIKTLDEMLHDDLLFITPDGQTITKKMDLDAHRSGNMVIEVLISNSTAINIIENTAISVSIIETKGKMLNQPIEGNFKYIRIWKLFTSSWKVIGGSCMQL